MPFNKRKSQPTTTRQPLRSLPTSKKSKFSYFDSRSVRETQPIRRPVDYASPNEQKRSAFGTYLSVVFLGIIFFILLAYVVILSPTPKIIINTTTPVLTDINPVTTYQAAAQKILSSSWTNRTKITINTSAIDSQMEQEFPELKDVSVSLPLIGNQLVLYLDPNIPSLILGVLPQGLYLLIDDNGQAIGSITNKQAVAAHLPIISDNNYLLVKKIGQAVLSSSEISFISLVLAQLHASHIITSGLSIPSGTLELDVRIQNQPYYVRFNLDDSADASQQVGTFLATQRYLSSQKIIPTQYIDARIPGRVYYK